MANRREETEGKERDTNGREEKLIAAQGSLEEALARYTDLYDFAPVPYVTLTHAGTIEEMNLPAAELLEVDRSRYQQMPFRQFINEKDTGTFRDHLHRCSKNTRQTKTELTIRTKTGRMIPVELSSGLGHRGRNGYVYSTAILSLVERRLAEAEREELLMKEQKAKMISETKDRFVAVLSHELRNPLSPVLAAMTILSREPLSDHARHILAVMKRNLDLELRLIDDLLDISRISTGKIKLVKGQVDVNIVIQEVLDMVSDEAAAKSLRLEAVLVAPRHYIVADDARLRQILLNLLRNALKFTHHGSIIVRTRNRGDDAQGGTIIIEVQDSGIGVAEDELKRLFQPFEQIRNVETSRAGLGLGLAISRGLVEAHEGRIWAKSAGKGKGSTFSFELPLSDLRPEEMPARGDSPNKTRNGHSLSILLVEDQQDSADLLAQLLEGEGHQVKVAGTVRTALDLFRASPPDLLIGDIGLPDGNGLDLMRQLRSIRPVKGIALSGFGTESDIAQSRSAGFSEHITKPVDLERLLEAVERASHEDR